jgi:hypothetical protein
VKIEKHVGSGVSAVVGGYLCACIYASKLTIMSYLLEGTAQHLNTVVEWQVHQDYVKFLSNFEISIFINKIF